MTPDQVFKRWVHGAIVVFVVAFVYFIVADIWLPLSAQARVMHPVVGIAPEVSGQVTQVLVQNNQQVKTGDILFSLDKQSYQLAVDKAELALEAAQQENTQLDAAIASAQASVAAYQAQADELGLEVKRLQQLIGSRSVSQQQLDKAAANYQAALAQVEAAKAQAHELVVRRGEPGEANLLLRQAANALANARLNLQYTDVRAKVDGVMTNLQLVPGNYATAGKTLAALVANLVVADALIILTDQQGLFDSDPRSNPGAELVREAPAQDSRLDAMAGGGGVLGRGGMATKVRAARLAARSGASTIIASGREVDVLRRLRDGEGLGTLLTPECNPQAARKQWLAGHLKARGSLVLDAGAVEVLKNSGRSLLPVGVKSVTGDFSRGEMVLCVDEQGQIVARGLVNYGADEALKIIDQPVTGRLVSLCRKHGEDFAVKIAREIIGLNACDEGGMTLLDPQPEQRIRPCAIDINGRHAKHAVSALAFIVREVVGDRFGAEIHQFEEGFQGQFDLSHPQFPGALLQRFSDQPFPGFLQVIFRQFGIC